MAGTLVVDAIKNASGEAQFGPVLSASVDTTSGTFKDITVPAWAKKITMRLTPLNGTDAFDGGSFSCLFE